MKEAYKGVEIGYNEDNEEFFVRIGDEVLANKRLKSLKDKIDRVLKTDFDSFELYHKTAWGDGVSRVKVTSITDSGELWVIDSTDNRRKKIRAEDAYLINGGNDGIMAAVKAKKAQIETLRHDIASSLKSMEKYNVQTPKA